MGLPGNLSRLLLAASHYYTGSVDCKETSEYTDKNTRHFLLKHFWKKTKKYKFFHIFVGEFSYFFKNIVYGIFLNHLPETVFYKCWLKWSSHFPLNWVQANSKANKYIYIYMCKVQDQWRIKVQWMELSKIMSL